MTPSRLSLLLVVAALVLAAPVARAELSAEELAKLAHFSFVKLPINTQVDAYYNVVRPDYAPNWQIRAQVQFMFPK